MSARTRPVPPFSPRRPLVLGFGTLVLLVGGLFGWGTMASLSGAVIAGGRVDVATRAQVVEHIDGGIVGEVLVRDGDRVKAGDMLIRLDDTLLRSEEVILEGQHAELVARRNRLEAEFNDAKAISWDPELARLAREGPALATILQGQERLYAARRASRASHVAQLRERIGQMRKQIASLQAQGRATERQQEFIARELEAQRWLYQQKMTGFGKYLELEREAARLEGQGGDLDARIAGARGRIAEVEIQILQIGTRRVEEAESQARTAQARENEVRERLASVRRRLGRMEVRAPVAGEVFDMRVFAPHEVVSPGEPIARIVPEETDLVVRAQLPPIHVDQVFPGQEGMLLFSAFPARITPRFKGRVLRVAADATVDERTGLSWYEVEVTMGRAIEPEEDLPIAAWARHTYDTVAGWIRTSSAGRVAGGGKSDASARGNGPGSGEVAGKSPPARPPRAAPGHARDLALVPGMPVEVHLRTGERSPLSYLTKPITDYFSRSLREE